MNFEGGYFLTSNFALGGFLAYHSNHEYFSLILPVGGSGSLNTDQQHTVFQLPSVLPRVTHGTAAVHSSRKYVGVHFGAQYAQR